MMRPPTALTIAGTDPSGGAGAQADLKAFTALGVYGTSVLTALVAQNTHGVSRVYDIDTDFVADQFDAVLDDMALDASKTGMLASAALVELTAARAERLGFLVVDTVMVATSGHRLLAEEAVEAMRHALLPVAGLITPNLPEAALLLGDDVEAARTAAEMEDQARALLARGPAAVLLKGGHGVEARVADVLALSPRLAGGAEPALVRFDHPRIDTPHTHGTGCTLSAAITAQMARRLLPGDAGGPGAGAAEALEPAVREGLDFLARALASGARWSLPLDPEGAHGPVDHTVDIAAQAPIEPARAPVEPAQVPNEAVQAPVEGASR
ncbi:bifunctional hydroxymethylpyrimidine kinase/phosphomethylpyrimidine kinase [Brevibacterium sp. BRM-1]|uniref:bifunctional hydroxymethylpyrimidine kinase/phosphomethylpyrimidine kinase n=1 Tax=Brevibacterium sp. BRM-1 TaxID=2999062 RepID=UPI00228263FF|nr:bifunctional hydroxymethylpyrimidine kinase/phosphomethylpyrimidine kinase [Brevibacterium sp. BRM-1]WAL40139.1 bifunctional hydroxymethylpyrimidine kinase/phosphomethylpyrimidine kinase [Brevibacterium sp. BRM-1]